MTMVRLNGSGWTVVACGVVAVLTGLYLRSPAVVGVGVSLLAASVVASAFSRRHAGLEVSRAVRPARPRAGATASVALRIGNNGPRATRRLRLEERTGSGSLTIEVPPLPVASEWTTTYDVVFPRRGAYRLGPLRSRTADPFGLTRGGGTIPGTLDVLVHPAIHRLLPIGDGRVRDLEGPTSSEAPEGGVAFHTLREYSPGDDLRLVHWRATARQGQLMVRKNVDADQPAAVLVVDVRRSAYESDTFFEEALEVAASFIASCALANAPLALALTRRDQGTVQVGRQDEREWDLLDTLATAAMTDDGVSPSATSALVATRDTRCTLIVLSGLMDETELSAITLAAAGFNRLVIGRLNSQRSRRSISHLHTIIPATSAPDFTRKWNGTIGS